jgi:hypothetical protein
MRLGLTPQSRARLAVRFTSCSNITVRTMSATFVTDSLVLLEASLTLQLMLNKRLLVLGEGTPARIIPFNLAMGFLSHEDPVEPSFLLAQSLSRLFGVHRAV